MLPRLERITIYPIKSLDGVDVDEAQVLANGALEHDRRFALVDSEGRFVNGKRTPAVHRIRATYDLAEETVHLHDTSRSTSAGFSLTNDASRLSRWLSAALEIACVVAENASSGFPDERDAPGPTVISTATLAAVASWFPGLTLEEVRRRFRANLEIDGVEPFWEDRLVGAENALVPFQIGAVRWLGAKACQRCVVPTRSADGGEPTPGFQKTFAGRREQTLPASSPRERFDHFYRLAVNTQLASGQSPARLRLGDTVEIG